MNIQGFQKTTLLDYPGQVAATVFFGGCNFRCPFCHNKDLVLTPLPAPSFSETEILNYLTRRKQILDGVCVTGGEPVLQPGLPDFLGKIKDLELKVKLDTNGYEPEVLADLVKEGLIDYVAMDVKGSLDAYAAISGVDALGLEGEFEKIKTSVRFLMSDAVDYEFRTTVVREFHNSADFVSIGQWLAGAKAYYLQGYVDSPEVISPGFSAYSRAELEEFRTLLMEYLPLVEIRGVDH